MSLNQELAELFRTLAAILEIKGEPVFKSIAFTRVARILDNMTVDIRQAVEAGTLGQIEGVGKSSQKIIEEYVRTGRSRDFEEAAATVPAGLLPMLQVPGLGPKTIALLWKERGITSLQELSEAIAQGKLAGLRGIGQKKIEQIRHGLELREQASRRIFIADALPLAEAMLEPLKKVPGVQQADIAGSLRRGRETIGDLDLIAGVSDDAVMGQVADVFTNLPEVKRVLAHGPTRCSVLTSSGVQVDLRIVPVEHFGAALQYFTGSKEHNVRLRGLALEKGLTLNEWGLYRIDEYDREKKETARPPAVKALASQTEAAIYSALGLPLIPPELREDRGEIEAAAAGKLPVLIERREIRGDLHCHTTASDGTASIEQMARAAQAMGYQFLAITDHSKSQVVANGLSAQRLLEHAAAIRATGERLKGITLLAGCEVDILADGRLDFEDDVLKELDFVVASPHVSLRQDTKKATERLLRAIEHRYVNVIGHPTGRLIHQRDGLPLDFSRIFDAAARTGTALEINCGYPRLDLSDIAARAAVAAGCKLSINTDAHSVEGFEAIRFGVQAARRAWVTADDVINCMTPARLRDFISRKR
ncbi:MAG: DNA polymerase/3'-5' exonuclease PolX [Phycisphaerae bacterium]|nr:DNA polymerase/3'-5' exonuclease PolX [Phycisphaerae bacterium]